jgi:molybdopterin synthase catalytic subunit
MTKVAIQAEPFDIAAEIAALSGGGNVGAVVTFTGHVRSDSTTTELNLEHYPGMTEREIARHIADAEARWPLLGVTVIHRIGALKPGDAIVLVVTASAHRKAAFEAAEFLMDFLKTRAPFWKRETRGGETHWVDARQSDDAAAKRWE